MAEELPLFLGLNDKTVTDIPKTVEKQRYMTSVAPQAKNLGKWIEMPRLPIPTGEHAVIGCGGKIHVIAGYAKHRVDQNFHQVYDSKSKSWSLKAPFPLPCNHVAGVAIGTKIYTFGGFVEQNRCPHSKCFVYDTTTDQWAPIAPISRPRGAISAIVLDGIIHLLGGRDVRSVEWHEIYDPSANKYTILGGMRGSTGTQPFVGQRDHMGLAIADGKIYAIAGRMDYTISTPVSTPSTIRRPMLGPSARRCRRRARDRRRSISKARLSSLAARPRAKCSAPTKPTIRRPTAGSSLRRWPSRATACTARLAR